MFYDFVTRGGLFSSEFGLVDLLSLLFVVVDFAACFFLSERIRATTLDTARRERRLAQRALRRQRAELLVGFDE